MTEKQTQRNELDQEMRRLRFRLQELETLRDQLETTDQRHSPREAGPVGIQFISELEVIEAQGIDQSDDGVQIELPRAMRFNLQLESDEEDVRRSAELIWARRQEDGRMRLGFQFVESHPLSAF